MGSIKLTSKHTVGCEVHHTVVRQFPVLAKTLDLSLCRLCAQMDVRCPCLHVLRYRAQLVGGLRQGCLLPDLRNVGQSSPRLYMRYSCAGWGKGQLLLPSCLWAGLLLAGKLGKSRVTFEQRVAEANHWSGSGTGFADAAQGPERRDGGQDRDGVFSGEPCSGVVFVGGRGLSHEHLERKLRQRTGRHDQQMLVFDEVLHLTE